MSALGRVRPRADHPLSAKMRVTPMRRGGHYASMPHASIATWNVDWAPVMSARSHCIRSRLAEPEPEVICLTEVVSGFLDDGYTIEADANYGYTNADGRRKVCLCSKAPWQNISRGEDLPFPNGRLVAGTTETSIGPIRVVGICIPWRDAHVRTGRRDRQPWEDHFEYLRALTTYLSSIERRTLVIGDFNQRVPKSRQPDEVYEALKQCFGRRFQIATAGLSDANGSTAIDHLALTHDLRIDSLWVMPSAGPDGSRLSDHFGFSCKLTLVEE